MTTNDFEFSLGDIQEIVAMAVPDREAMRWRQHSQTYRELTDRTRRLASYLRDRGLGAVTPRSSLELWESGQDFVGILMYNRPEYIEALFGAFKARCVPYNINYRYRTAEVQQLLAEAPTRAIVYEAEFSNIVASLAGSLHPDVALIEVGGAGRPAVEGGVPYEQVLSASTPTPPPRLAPDDLYVVFTGGTTGRPKAVLWRQADAFVSVLSGSSAQSDDRRSPVEVVQDAISRIPRVVLPVPPFMHGGGQWVALGNILRGNTVVIQDTVDRLDADDIWRTVERESVYMMLITGNAYGLPLIDELEHNTYDLRALRQIVTGAVAMTDDVKEQLLEHLPNVRIVETLGATESGTHLTSTTSAMSTSSTFTPSADTVVLDEARRLRLAPGHAGIGWVARRGRIPLGYLNDKERTMETFPTIDGIRYSVPGDKGQLLHDGSLQFLGRDSVTINSGGEKVFAEEVERALLSQKEVYDAVVTGRPHPRWGQEVVAIVSLRDGVTISEEELRQAVSQLLAGFKVPKRIAFVDSVPRNPVGKLDYAWAKAQAEHI